VERDNFWAVDSMTIRVQGDVELAILADALEGAGRRLREPADRLAIVETRSATSAVRFSTIAQAAELPRPSRAAQS
jgi:hypothetical protein